MKIAIIGAGAMGSRFGYMLQEAGNNVFLVDTWKQHVEIINKDGLLVDDNDTLKTIKIPIFFPEEVNEIPDLIILFYQVNGIKTHVKKYRENNWQKYTSFMSIKWIGTQ